MDLSLRGKVALVTGSSRGIGLATAKAFAVEGCRVMLSARSTEQLREAETALRATGAEVAAHAADVGSPDGATRLIEATIAAQFKRVANAVLPPRVTLSMSPASSATTTRGP